MSDASETVVFADGPLAGTEYVFLIGAIDPLFFGHLSYEGGSKWVRLHPKPDDWPHGDVLTYVATGLDEEGRSVYSLESSDAPATLAG